jgi:hypothetical protein
MNRVFRSAVDCPKGQSHLHVVPMCGVPSDIENQNSPATLCKEATDMIRSHLKLTGGWVLGLSVIASQLAPAQTPPSLAEVRAIAKEAYIYAFAMLESYNTMYKQVGTPGSREYVGGFGQFRHYAEAFTPDNHDIVTPNNDTPYSWAWLDLRAEPWVVTVPEVSDNRYYVQQWVDLYTYNFAYIGSRATGNHAGNFMIAGPKWKGNTPPGIRKVFHSETEIVMSLTRTALNGPEDVDAMKAVQAGMKLQPLSSFEHKAAPPAAPAITFPPYDAAKARSHDFIGYLDFLLQFAQPPHQSEEKLMKRFATIGIDPGKPFDAASLPPATLAAIDEGVKDAQSAMAEKAKATQSSNGLFGSRADLKNDYLTRAIGRKGAVRQFTGRGLVWRLCGRRNQAPVDPFRERPVSAREILLVDHALYPARSLPLRERPEALFDRRPDEGPEARPGWWIDTVPRPHFAGTGQGVQLAARAGRQVQRGGARLRAQQGGDRQDLEAPAAHAG